MIQRIIQGTLQAEFFKGKVILILGARQVGKTTLLENLEKQTDAPILHLNADEPDVRTKLTEVTSSQLKQLIGPHKIVVIDEAQRIQNIGITLKLMVDQIKGIQIIATGSSAFELANKINEPLTGRKFEHHMFPISYQEMVQHHGLLEEQRLLETRLIYGMYPDVINNPGAQKKTLDYLTSSYVYKDIFALQDLRRPDLIEKLLQALALQVCSEVSYHELAQTISADPVTVEKYIHLLEKAFVIFRLYSLSRNHRNELKKSKKVYFYDNGLRNAIISNFNPLALRNDVGALWENYLVSERLKTTKYQDIYCNRFFWRTLQQQEIDYIEEREGILFAYEFKWKTPKKEHFPKTFINTYPTSITQTISPENMHDFLMP